MALAKGEFSYIKKNFTIIMNEIDKKLNKFIDLNLKI